MSNVVLRKNPARICGSRRFFRIVNMMAGCGLVGQARPSKRVDRSELKGLAGSCDRSTARADQAHHNSLRSKAEGVRQNLRIQEAFSSAHRSRSIRRLSPRVDPLDSSRNPHSPIGPELFSAKFLCHSKLSDILRHVRTCEELNPFDQRGW